MKDTLYRNFDRYHERNRNKSTYNSPNPTPKNQTNKNNKRV